MNSMQEYTGINIQWPISQLILSGKKSVETRTYPIPPAYLNKDILLVETPGHRGKFKARIIAKVRFSSCFLYSSEQLFEADFERHHVSKTSEWTWTKDKPKWGWVIAEMNPVIPFREVTKRLGIRYTTGLNIGI